MTVMTVSIDDHVDDHISDDRIRDDRISDDHVDDALPVWPRRPSFLRRSVLRRPVSVATAVKV